MKRTAAQATSFLLIISMLLSGCSGDVVEEISGCMDELAENYNPDATAEGDCTYPDSDGDGVWDFDEIPGCMDSNATNYDSGATDDDLSCDYWEPTYTDQWEKHIPENEECMCSDGSEYSFYSREGDSDVAVLFQNGGGACWHEFTSTIAVS